MLEKIARYLLAWSFILACAVMYGCVLLAIAWRLWNI